MAHSIGAFQFVNLRGQPGSYAPEIERIVRPGTENAAFRQLGKRGQPFTLQSVVDVLDIASGRTLFSQYTNAISQDPATLIWNDYNFSSESLLVQPMQVAILLLERRVKFVGNTITPNPGAWLEVRWDLVFTT